MSSPTADWSTASSAGSSERSSRTRRTIHAFASNLSANIDNPRSVTVPAGLLTAMGISVAALAGSGIVQGVKVQQDNQVDGDTFAQVTRYAATGIRSESSWRTWRRVWSIRRPAAVVKEPEGSASSRGGRPRTPRGA